MDNMIFNINSKIHVGGKVDAMEVMVTSRGMTLVNHQLWANARLSPLCNDNRQVGLSYVNLYTYINNDNVRECNVREHNNKQHTPSPFHRSRQRWHHRGSRL
jgi:hypothetical protein